MAAALPLVKVPAFDRLSQQTVLNIKQTSSGYQGNNYTVLGEGDEVLLTLNEIVPDTIFRGGAQRVFHFDGVDNMGKKLFSFGRPAGEIFLPDKVELFMNEALVGRVHLAHTFLTPIFSITNELDNPVLRLKGQRFDYKYFQLQTPEKKNIGAVQKKYRGTENMFSLKDDYIISFPADLAVPFKIAVIVACVYIDFRFSEGR